MPVLTADGLRGAVAQISPDNLPAFVDQLSRAATQAHSSDSLAPLRSFTQRWALFVSIERYPARAARLHTCERIVRDSPDADRRREAVREISRILDEAG
jgi:hypothetical protein